jgi:short-subunit dehydrogenase
LAHHYGARLLARGRGGLIVMSSLAGLGGAGLLATYAASKGFGWLFAESLWKEWGPRGVDVLAGVAGLTDTPHAAASGVDMGHMPAMDPKDVVRELLDALGREPCWVAGEGNRQGLAALEALPRRQRIEGLSASTALLYGFGES